MRIVTIKCPSCNDIIYSRAQHDFNVCSCKETKIDGGHFDPETKRWTFERVLGNKICAEIKEVGDKIPTQLYEVDVTPNQLYDDWNTRGDKYGKIRIKRTTSITDYESEDFGGDFEDINK